MTTYPVEKIMDDYGNGRMTVEMTTGHALQHIQQLHHDVRATNQQRQKLRDQVDALKSMVATLQTNEKRYRKLRDKVTGLQKDVESVRAKLNRFWEQQEQVSNTEKEALGANTDQMTALNLTVRQVKAEVDSLKQKLDAADSTKN